MITHFYMLSLAHYQALASHSDQFGEDRASADQLRYGFFGEVGSLLSSVKKAHRDTFAPSERESAEEELGDALWYLTALIRRASLQLEVVGEETIRRLQKLLSAGEGTRSTDGTTFDEIDGLLSYQSKNLPDPKDVLLYRLASLTGQMFGEEAVIGNPDTVATFADLLAVLAMLAAKFGLKLSVIAEVNIYKARSRWPTKIDYDEPFDETFEPYEQLPRKFSIEFIERVVRGKTLIVQQLRSVNIGDPLTDNREDGDGYRYHDVFHLAYIAHLGWSPVVRGLLKLKRKSRSNVDENEDGARAMIIEEGIATWIFNYAREHNYFENVESGKLPYSVLKQVKSMVKGYEVERCPLWQWEHAILDGFKVFRELRKAREGIIEIDMNEHSIRFKNRRDET